MRVTALLIALISLTWVLSACGTNVGNNKSIYSFETTDIQDKSVGLSNEKPTLIYFMAAWCPTCVGGEKVFADLHDQYGDKIQLITVDVDPSMDTEENLGEFQKKYGGNWPHVLDKDQKITTQFQVKQLEEVYVINKDSEQVLHEINPSINKLKDVLAELGVKP